MFSWSDFLSLAKQLGADADEASKRTAVSRAYYAAFHVARAWLVTETNVYVPTHGGAHDAVLDEFERRGDRDSVSIAHSGRRLKDKRRKADYEQHVRNFGSLVQPALLEAQQVITIIKTLSP